MIIFTVCPIPGFNLLVEACGTTHVAIPNNYIRCYFSGTFDVIDSMGYSLPDIH